MENTTTKTLINTNKVIKVMVLDEEGKPTLNEDGTFLKVNAIGKSKYAKRLEEDNLKESEFNAHKIENALSKDYEARITSKGIVIYRGKERTIDIKVQNGKVKIFNHLSIEEYKEELEKFGTIDEDLPTYKAKDYTNALYVPNEKAFNAIRFIAKRS